MRAPIVHALGALLIVILSGSCLTTETTLCANSDRRCPGGTQCTAAGDGCITGTCGNGVIDPGEICDDGNLVNGDDCSRDCQSSTTCGNGTIDPGEACDDSNNVSGDGCSADCRSDETCGNGFLDPAAG
jgi:cysteine-rich repeat protein